MDYTERFITAAPLRDEVEKLELAATRIRGRLESLLVTLSACGDSRVGRAQIKKSHPGRILEMLNEAEQVLYDMTEKL